MVSKKKSGKALLGVEVAELSRFNEDFDEAMREFKERLEAKRLERQKAFKEYEKQYQKAKDENYRILGVEFLKALGLDNFGSLKELMSDKENQKALNAKKDFAILFEKNNKFIRKVFSFIANDELVRTALDEFIEEQKAKEAERLGGGDANAAADGDGVTAVGSKDKENSDDVESDDVESDGSADKENAGFGLNLDSDAEKTEENSSGGSEDEAVLL